MLGIVYTFLASSRGIGSILTAEGPVALGQSGFFLPNEYQSAVNAGCQLVAGPAYSPFFDLAPPTVAASATSGSPNGTYKCAVTFITAAGETKIGPEVSITVSSKQILWSNIPAPNVWDGVIARKLYRTIAGGASGTEKLVATINDNSTTTYTDNVADGALGAAAPTSDTAGVIGVPEAAQFVPTLYATLSGLPNDDQYAIGAGTGIEISGTGGGGGTPGATGATGPAGATGATGSTGPQGLQGPPGPTGPAGSGGSSNSNGSTVGLPVNTALPVIS